MYGHDNTERAELSTKSVGSDYYPRGGEDRPVATIEGVIEFQGTLIASLFDSFSALERRLTFVLVPDLDENKAQSSVPIPPNPNVSPALTKIDQHNESLDMLGRALVNLRQRVNLD